LQPVEDDRKHGGPPEGAAAQPGSVVLGAARYVPLSPEQERDAIAALARLLALVREHRHQQSS